MAEKISDSQVSDLSAALRSEASVDVKLQQLTSVKSGIKQHNVPESCVAPLFEALRVASTNQHATIANAGFTALNHLLTRLSRQEPKFISKADPRILSLIVDKLGDQKEKLRALAVQALATFHGAAPIDVERNVRNLGMAGKNPRAKEASMQWLLQMHQEHGLQFRAFVPPLMELLEDADPGVRDVAKVTVIELFRNAPNAAKSDLKKQLKNFKVRPAIEQAIIKELIYTSPVAAPPQSDSPVDVPRPPSRPNLSASVSSISSERPATPLTEGGAEPVDPMYVNTNRELDDIFRDMQEYFEGRETEQNWLKREESVTKLRRLIAGNASTDFVDSLVSGLRAMLDGILKAVNSLRTSLSKEGCSLVQDMATTLGPAIDPMVELLMQTLIKLSAATKKISSQLANSTVDTIIGKVTYTNRIMQHVWNACQDKNVQPRSYAAGWVKTLLSKESSHKSHVEHGGGLDVIDKCIKKGLDDANPGVRENMRSTYWVYAQYWPARAEAIMASLDPTAQKKLNSDPGNPNPVKSDGPARPGLGLSKSTMGSAKPSLRETMMSQKMALAAERKVPARPGSAMSHFSPVRTVSNSSTASTSSITATPAVRDPRKRPESTAGLLGAPMRPARRRPDVTRPATAGPYSVRSHDQPSAEATSPSLATPKPLDTPARRTRPGHLPHASDSSIPSPTRVVPANAASPPRTQIPRVTPPRSTPTWTPTRTGSNQTTPTPTRFAPSRISPPRLRPTQSAIHVSSPSKAHEDMTMVVPKIPALKMLADEKHESEEPRPDEQEKGELLVEVAQVEESPAGETGVEELEAVADTTQPDGEHFVEATRTVPAAQATPRLLSSTPVGSPHTPKLKVFEDPSSDGLETPRPKFSGRVLEDKHVNEDMATAARRTHESPVVDDAPGTGLSGEAQVNTRLLESGMTRIQAKSLDVHGFRKLQSLLREGKISLSDESFDGMALGLFQYLQDPLADLKLEKAQDVKVQILATIKILLAKDRERFKPYVSVGLESLMLTRSGYESRAYIVSGLELLAEDLSELGEPSEVMATMSTWLQGDMDQHQALAESISAAQMTEMWRRVGMGLHVLRCVLERGAGLPLADSEVERLVALAKRCLVSNDSGVRMETVQMCVSMHARIGDTEFWDALSEVGDDAKSLMTYYIARRQRGKVGLKA